MSAMTRLMLMSLLALAACGETAGWHPDYQMGPTPYGRYLAAREAALTGQTPEAPRVIPVALPAKAPTAAEIAGTRPAPARAAVPAVPAARGYAATPPVLVQYARTHRHATGTKMWPRSGVVPANACAPYPTPADAQKAFLAKGGPVRDPAGLDPDGDGFVCGWDPAAYRDGGL